MTETTGFFVVAGSRQMDEKTAEVVRAAVEPIQGGMRGDLAKCKERRVRAMIEVIIEQLLKPGLTVAWLKKECGIRDNSVAISFSRDLGEAPKEYMLTRRLDCAARLLRLDEDMRVWRIAEVTGFSSLGVLSKAFNRAFGVRPTVYRRQGVEETTQCAWSMATLRSVIEGRAEEDVAQQIMVELVTRYPEVWRELADDRRTMED